ncbi:MAG: hypothetical protein IKU43_09180 [Clostridia bacterium]|nr:hypothetical protein [Clostridia bacterium]
MGFNEYLLTVTAAGAIGVVSDIVNTSYSGRIKGLAGYIKFGTAVCVVACIVIPLLTFGKSGELYGIINEIPKITESNYTENSLYLLERECEEKLVTEITEKCGITLSDTEISLKWNGERPCLERVVLTVESLTPENRVILEEAVRSALGTDEFETVYKE